MHSIPSMNSSIVVPLDSLVLPHPAHYRAPDRRMGDVIIDEAQLPRDRPHQAVAVALDIFHA